MIYSYESHEELALRDSKAQPNVKWLNDVANGMDIADHIEATYNESSNDDQEQEYRDERDDSSRLADRHGC